MVVVCTSVGHDAALLALAALAWGGTANTRACRKERRRALKRLDDANTHPAIRAGAELAIRRSCGACGCCKGV